MNIVYSVGSKRLIDSDLKNISHCDNIYDIPDKAKIINLHSADTICNIGLDDSYLNEKKCTFYGCNLEIFKVRISV